MTLVEYITSSYDIALEINIQKEIETRNKKNPKEAETDSEKYETLLRKEEANIRQHIKVNLLFFININIFYIDRESTQIMY